MFSHSLKATQIELADLFSGNLLICSVKALFRIILGLESRHREVVFSGPIFLDKVDQKVSYGGPKE